MRIELPARARRPASRRAVAMAAVLLLGALIGTPPVEPARGGVEPRPDLSMAPLSDFRIQWVNGRRLLRFTAMMVNIGQTHFEVRGSRTSTSQPMVIRHVHFADASRDNVIRQVTTDAVAKYAGDGHNHWHVQEMMRYDLWGGPGTFRGAKVGFCFLDSDLYTSNLPGYSGGFYNGSRCSSNPNALSNSMGISIGMGDEYTWDLAWQWVDITGMPAGNYTLRAKVDPYGFFEESNNANQCAWATLSFTTTSNTVTLLARDNGDNNDCVNDWSGSPFAADIAWMMSSGISTGCGPELFCTQNRVTRGEMAAFLDRARNLPQTSVDFFDDDAGSSFQPNINRLAAAGITTGCATRRFCPSSNVTRAEMAVFLSRAFALPETTTDYFPDDNGTFYEPFINRVAEAGISNGCAPNRYCPTRQVTRGEMAAFLHRAMD